MFSFLSPYTTFLSTTKQFIVSMNSCILAPYHYFCLSYSASVSVSHSPHTHPYCPIYKLFKSFMGHLWMAQWNFHSWNSIQEWNLIPNIVKTVEINWTISKINARHCVMVTVGLRQRFHLTTNSGLVYSIPYSSTLTMRVNITPVTA